MMSTVKNLPVGADFILTHHATSYDYISPLKLDFAGQHVLITGAAHEDGVGYATATAFAHVEASRIACCDLRGVFDDFITKLNQESVEAMYDSIAEEFNGRLDILVNNAAHMEPYKPFLESDPDISWGT
ncbi:NAD(P)-binding Rossmann-fold containing protein [Fusarium coicis]|nr:NAD(P)-binding Rossmann-fold containing protein [Fusarium coicis]